jgi:DNA-binding NtrC family response regulator
MSVFLRQPKTGSMCLRDKIGGPSESGSTFAGLVLLYSPSFEEVPPAFPFRKAEIAIGRDESNDLVLYDQAASRRHAVVRYEGGRWRIHDTASRNGVFVDGERVGGPVELTQGAEMRIGDTLFKFEGLSVEAFVRHRIDGVVAGESPEAASARRARPLVGGALIDRLLRRAERVAQGPISVLVTGESGTGKELLARHLHAASGRKGPFVAINCAAVPEPLFEAELFGVARGAYTSADRDRAGLFREADGGTLFLDEVGELPLGAQAKLLRAVEEGAVTPLGGTRLEHADVRILCATHQDLRAMEKQRKFRGDLLARLAKFELSPPPLRDRKEDLYLLCRHFLRAAGAADKRLSLPFLAALFDYDFPYNLRELSSILSTALVLCEGDALLRRDLPERFQEALGDGGSPSDLRTNGQRAALVMGPAGGPAPAPPPRPHGDAEDAVRGPTRLPAQVPTPEELVDAMSRHRGNLAAVGRSFGKKVMTVRRWLARYELHPEDFR